MIRKEEVKPDNGRVTAGVPSLDSPKRFVHDSVAVSRDYMDAIEQEEKACLDRSVAPDGNRPTTKEDTCEGMWLHPDVFMKKLIRLLGSHRVQFIRSTAAPSQMGVYLKVPVTIDEPEGLRYVCGFPAEDKVREFNFNCTEERMMHTREGFLKKVIIPCQKRECKRCHGLKHIPGWRKTLFRLMEAGALTETQVDKEFLRNSESRNWQRAISGT